MASALRPPAWRRPESKGCATLNHEHAGGRMVHASTVCTPLEVDLCGEPVQTGALDISRFQPVRTIRGVEDRDRRVIQGIEQVKAAPDARTSELEDLRETDIHSVEPIVQGTACRARTGSPPSWLPSDSARASAGPARWSAPVSP